jgi:hypothetical protein
LVKSKIQTLKAQENITAVSTIVIVSLISFLIGVKFLETVKVLPSKIKEVEQNEISIKIILKKMLAILDEKNFITIAKLTGQY